MLTQAEANQFMQMAKHFVRPPASVTIPPGIDETHELAGLDDRERFLLDIWRGTFRLRKLKFQNRVRTVIVLVRLDVDGAPHTNPDGQRLPGTHLHLFREGYGQHFRLPVDSKRHASRPEWRIGGRGLRFPERSGATVGGDVIEALNAYRVISAVWSERANYVQALSAN